MVFSTYVAQVVVLSAAFAFLGAGLHEAMHYLVAWAHGWDARIDARELATVVEPGTVVEQWEIAAFALAPLVTGLLVAPLVWTHLSVPLLAGWAFYSFGGIRNDVRLAVGQAPDPGSTPGAATRGD